MLWFCCQSTMKCTEAIFLFFAARDRGNRNGSKLEKKLAFFFPNFETLVSESRQKLNTNCSLCHTIFRIISVSCQECYTCELENSFKF